MNRWWSAYSKLHVHIMDEFLTYQLKQFWWPVSLQWKVQKTQGWEQSMLCVLKLTSFTSCSSLDFTTLWMKLIGSSLVAALSKNCIVTHIYTIMTNNQKVIKLQTAFNYGESGFFSKFTWGWWDGNIKTNLQVQTHNN